jgi:hypothetical protein
MDAISHRYAFRTGGTDAREVEEAANGSRINFPVADGSRRGEGVADGLEPMVIHLTPNAALTQSEVMCPLADLLLKAPVHGCPANQCRARLLRRDVARAGI